MIYRRIFATVFLLAASPVLALAQSAGTLTILNSTGATVTVPTDVNGGNNTPHSVPEIAGARVSSSNPMPVSQLHPVLPGVAVTSGNAALSVTASAYTSNMLIGPTTGGVGYIKFPGVLQTAGGSASVDGFLVWLQSQANTPGLTLMLFCAPPTSGTYTDHAVYTPNATDFASYLGFLTSGQYWQGAGGGTPSSQVGQSGADTRDVYNCEGTPTTNIYGLLVFNTGTYTPTATTDIAGTLKLVNVQH